MANGSPPFRRLAAGSRAARSLRNVRPAKALITRHDRQHLHQNIKQNIQRCTGKPVMAFVCMAMYEDGEVSTHATDNIQQLPDDIFASNARESLRTSLLQAEPDHEMHESNTVPLGTLRDVITARSLRNGRLVSTRVPIFDDDSCYASRPASARTLGSTSGWPSDTDSPGSLGGLPSTGSRVGSISRIESPAKLQSLMISESSKVEDFLARALRTMQQLAVKRIAKAWIKGICPRKQAVFPYHKKSKESGDRVHISANNPEWWPDEKLCKFIEPDHIKRDERINLCLHLLRLRPTPAQLKEWNKNCVEPHPTHLNKGWTEFLKELAPPSTCEDPRGTDDKTEERQKLLAQIYDLAKREERYLDEEIDGTDRFMWHDDSLCRSSAKRKMPRPNFSVDESDIDSVAGSARPSKRSKKTSVSATSAGSPPAIVPTETEYDDQMQDSKPPVFAESFNDHGSSRSASAASSHRKWTQDAKDPDLTTPVHEQVPANQTASNYPQPHPASPSWVGTSMPSSFASIDLSGQSMPQGAFAIEAPISTYPGCHNYQFPQHNPEHALVPFRSAYPYVTTQASQPQLESLPLSTDYPTPVVSMPTYVGLGQYHNIVGYCGQPDHAQSQLFAVPGPATMNTQFEYSVPPNTPFLHGDPSQQPFYTVDPVASYQYHHETEPPFYPMSGTCHNNAFQAPARVERGFTGHASGVGGGAHT